MHLPLIGFACGFASHFIPFYVANSVHFGVKCIEPFLADAMGRSTVERHRGKFLETCRVGKFLDGSEKHQVWNASLFDSKTASKALPQEAVFASTLLPPLAPLASISQRPKNLAVTTGASSQRKGLTLESFDFTTSRVSRCSPHRMGQLHRMAQLHEDYPKQIARLVWNRHTAEFSQLLVEVFTTVDLEIVSLWVLPQRGPKAIWLCSQ